MYFLLFITVEVEWGRKVREKMRGKKYFSKAASGDKKDTKRMNCTSNVTIDNVLFY